MTKENGRTFDEDPLEGLDAAERENLWRRWVSLRATRAALRAAGFDEEPLFAPEIEEGR
jgi:hypothetical protein